MFSSKEKKARFQTALNNGDVATAKSLIGVVHLNFRERKGLLYDVVTRGNKEILDLLLSRNYPRKKTLNNLFGMRKSIWGAKSHEPSLIVRAAGDGHAEVVNSLSAAPCLKFSPRELNEAFLCAVEKQHSEVVKILLENVDIGARNVYNSTPLHIAASNGDEESVKLLLAARSDITAEDWQQCNPLHLAAKSGNSAVVKLLLDAKADLTKTDCDQKTPLHIASKHGHAEIVSMLLSADADLTARDRWKQTSLHHAVQGVMDISENKSPLGYYGARYRHSFVYAGSTPEREETVRLLLKAGADLNHMTAFSENPLHCVMRRGWTKIASILLEANASVTAKNSQGLTALHIACRYAGWHSATDAVKLLLKAGADVNLPDNYGKTPLYYAAVPPNSNTQFTMTLLDAGAKFSWNGEIGTMIKNSVYWDSRKAITDLIKQWQRENRVKRAKKVGKQIKKRRRPRHSPPSIQDVDMEIVGTSVDKGDHRRMSSRSSIISAEESISDGSFSNSNSCSGSGNSGDDGSGGGSDDGGSCGD